MTNTDISFEKYCAILQGYAERLVAVCDGANSEDFQGFSKAHASFGRVIAHTPVEFWTNELAEQAADVLIRYSLTQLEDGHDAILEIRRDLKEIRTTKQGAVRARLGIEQGKLSILSAGFGDAQAHKKLKAELDRAGFTYDSGHSTWRMNKDSLTAAESASLKKVLDQVATDAEVERLSDKLIRGGRAKSHYIEAFSDGLVRVVFDYDPLLVQSFKAASQGVRRVFRGDTQPKCWEIWPTGKFAQALLDWADLAKMNFNNDAHSTLTKWAKMVVKQFNPHEIYLEGGSVVIPTLEFNRTLITWLQQNLSGYARFSKTGPDGAVGVCASACWLLKIRYAHLVKPLLEVQPWGQYVATLGVREAIKMAESDIAEQGTRALNSSAKTSDWTVSRPIGGVLRPFQNAGVSYALNVIRPHHGVLINDDMGLGKTCESLVVVNELQAFPLIVVCPASAKYNWQNEVKLWLPGITTTVLEGETSMPLPQVDIYIVNYDILAARLPELLALRAKAVIVDEYHYFMHQESARSIAGRMLIDGTEEVIKEVNGVKKREIVRHHEGIVTRIGLSGTPMPNRTFDLVSPLSIFGRLEDLGGFWSFVKRYCAATKGDYGWNMKGSSNAVELNTLMRATCWLRREKTDVATELPPKQRVQLSVDISNRQEYVEAEMNLLLWIAKHGGDVESAARAEELSRMNHLRQLAGEGVIDAALDWAKDFLTSSDKKLIIFSHHTKVQKQLFEELVKLGYGVQRVAGGMSAPDRQAAVDAFQKDPTQRVVVCSLKGASEAITLTAASHVLLTEPDWTSSRMDQAEDRAHRIGQRDNVTAYYLLGRKTIHEDLWEMTSKKRDIIRAVVSGVDYPDDESVIDAVRRAFADRAAELARR